MAKKMGCGPMAAFMLIVLILLLVGSNEAVGYYFSRCDQEDMFDCLMGKLDEPEEEEGSVTATGTYSYKGYDVTISMNIPLAGGAVTGNVSGTCEGMVKGTYGGQNGGAISGRLSGVCSPFFVNIPSSADFSGSVNKTGKTVPIRFNGQGAGFKHEGSMVLSY